MRSIEDIRRMRTTVTHIGEYNVGGEHESTLRSYQILERVKEWLNRGVPADVILELIAEMEGGHP